VLIERLRFLDMLQVKRSIFFMNNDNQAPQTQTQDQPAPVIPVLPHQQQPVQAAYQQPPVQPTPAPKDPDMLDLDELVPDNVKIKFGGNIISMSQPSTEDLLKLMKLAKNLSSMDEAAAMVDLAQGTGEITQVLEGIASIARGLAPELKDAKFTIAQSFALIKLLTEMSMPSNLVELQQRGITPSEVPKGAAS
jgi:hypothetical protein